MRVIYADEVIAVNMAVNYILLVFTARTVSAQTPRLRLALGAAIGAVYALAVEIGQLPWLDTAAVKLAAAALMLLAAFGAERRYAGKLLLFLGAASALAGASVMVSSLYGGGQGALLAAPDIRVLVPSFAVCWLVFTVLLRGRAGKAVSSTVTAEIHACGRCITVSTLLDTGCGLTDPVSGSPVLVVYARALEGLLAAADMQAVLETDDAVQLVERLSAEGSRLRLCLLPYSAVGVEHGLLAAFRPDEVRLNGKIKKGMLVAISRTELSGGAYLALTGA